MALQNQLVISGFVWQYRLRPPDVACFLFGDDAMVIDPQPAEIDDLGFAGSGRVLSNKYIVSNADVQQYEANIRASSAEKKVLWLSTVQLQCHYPRYWSGQPAASYQG